jgi:acetyl-CoA decarbonylase/synthase complex subunit gamma
MALTGLDIYKKLPRTNCGECGVPTCLAFAMKLAGGQAELAACPHVTDEVISELEEASAPPIRLVTVGRGEKEFKVGGETVLYRHEKTFVNPPGLGVLIEASTDDAEIEEKAKQATGLNFERVGQMLRASLVAVKADSDASRFAEVVQKVSSMTDLPLMLISDDVEAMKQAIGPVADKRPLICGANKDNYEAMAGLAKEKTCPLVVSEPAGLPALAELTEKVAALGIKDIVLDPHADAGADTLKNLTFIRRAALKQRFRPLGYPVVTWPSDEEDDMLETVMAAVHVAKYGGIIILKSLEPWKALPLLVLSQNIYTDPQRPLTVEQGVYEIGSPDENSPVMITTNFSLTYFIVSSEIESSKVSSWLCIMDSEGLSVLTAWAAGKFVPERIGNFFNKSGIDQKVNHRKLVIPGFVSQIKGELEEEIPDWEILVGPREATDIPAYLKKWSA